MMRFTKMHALGNDYVYVETFTQKPCEGYSYDIPALARFVSHRRYGIGSDGLVLIHHRRLDVLGDEEILLGESERRSQENNS